MLSDRQSLRCAVKRKIVNTPTSEKIPNLYSHRALNRKNTVLLSYLKCVACCPVHAHTKTINISANNGPIANRIRSNGLVWCFPRHFRLSSSAVYYKPNSCFDNIGILYFLYLYSLAIVPSHQTFILGYLIHIQCVSFYISMFIYTSNRIPDSSC